MTVTVLRWGIISTGNIAASFTRDLLINPSTRGVHDILHKIAAVGSRTVEKAKDFIDRCAQGDQSIKAYGTYEEVYADKDVDVVYIGTPHTYHHTNALDAIKAGKHVLCEKPVTSNLAELRSLIASAKEYNVFFMEALWTRFHPLSLEVKKIAEEGTLGLPVMLHADLSLNYHIHDLPLTHRILDPDLGGGALLDLGSYPLFWAILALFENPANAANYPSKIQGSMLKTPLTNVDTGTLFNLTFDSQSNGNNKFAAQASLNCNITIDDIQPGVTIRFERGNILIRSPIYCPKEFTVQYLSDDGVKREEKRTFEYVGKGLHFQADEVARCIREGRLESKLWGHDKSILEMTIFDEVRRQGEYKFPPGVEKVIE
ncbi:NAD(P)-binding protein [Phlegmacium glaucopus]|nr:NAD(P)-binding protein [Phlegmacium glaucopus]